MLHPNWYPSLLRRPDLGRHVDLDVERHRDLSPNARFVASRCVGRQSWVGKLLKEKEGEKQKRSCASAHSVCSFIQDHVTAATSM